MIAADAGKGIQGAGERICSRGKNVKTISRDSENLDDIVIVRGEDNISTELDGETVILDIGSGVYSGLDQVGTTIWNALENPVRFGDVVQQILAVYDVDQEQCEKDLIEFLNSLSENKLISYR